MSLKPTQARSSSHFGVARPRPAPTRVFGYALVIDKLLERISIDPNICFANPLRFPPARTEGIVVIRPPRPVLRAIQATLESVRAGLTSKPLKGMLWIVELGRIRVYDPHDESDL